MCDCALCRTIREEFGAREGEEHKVLGQIVESHQMMSMTLQKLDNKLNECYNKIKKHKISSDDIFQQGETSGTLIEQTYMRKKAEIREENENET